MSVLPKKELKHLLSQGLREEVFVHLLEHWESVGGITDRYNAVVLLRGEFVRISNDLNLNLIEHPTANHRFSRITAALLDNIDALPNQPISAPPSDIIDASALRVAVEKLAADHAWQYDIFFSFSSKDLNDAKNCCDVLRGYGLRVFFSADDLRERAGHNFGNVIESALKNSRHFLLYCTPNAMDSYWVEWEWEIFFQMCYLPNRRVRQFHIMEGPKFHPSLVPFRCQLIQRAKDAASILSILSSNDLQLSAPLTSPTIDKPAAPRIRPADQAAWDFAVETNSRAAFDWYLEKFPSGFYVEQALDSLDTIELDSIDWEIVEKSGSENAYRRYLSKHPEGQYSMAATAKIREFEKAKDPVQEPISIQEPLVISTTNNSESFVNQPRYQIERALGHGGFSTVYLAWDNKDGCWVAVKVFVKKGGEEARICRLEYEHTKALDHPNIIRVLDHGSHGLAFDYGIEDRPFIVMPFYNSGRLQDRLGKFSEEDLWRVVLDISGALSYIHQCTPPLLHNDIEPSNILITDESGYVLSDFGISMKELPRQSLTAEDNSLRHDGDYVEAPGVGPMAYRAPETFQYRDHRKNQPNTASDIWSFGATLYELATGKVPFGDQGGLYQLMQLKDYGKRLSSVVDPLPGRFTGSINSLVFECLSPDLQERPKAEDLYHWAKSKII